MRYLYVLLVLSLAVLLWAAIAIARHIRRHDTQATVLESESATLYEADARSHSGELEASESTRAGDARSDNFK
jgi:hypothetical protein